MIRARYAATLGLLLLVAPLLAAENGRDVLIRSLEREREAAYAGVQTTIVIDGDKRRKTVQVVKRRPPGKLRIEYRAPADLRGELVVDDGERFRHYIPALKVVEEGGSRLKRAQRRYQSRIKSIREGESTVTLTGEAEILRRKVDVVTVQPKRSGRPTRTFWLDRQTGVALKVEEKRPSGRRSITRFVRIRFNPILGDSEFQFLIPEGATVVPASMGRPISLRRAEQRAQELWGGLPTPTALPPGYTLTSAHEMRFRGRPVVALRYTLGSSALSLFVSGGGGEPFSAPVRHRLNVVQRPMGGVLVTVVGSLPPDELQRIVGSIRTASASP